MTIKKLSKISKSSKLKRASLLLTLWALVALIISCGEQVSGTASQAQNNEIIGYTLCTQANNITSAINSTPRTNPAGDLIDPYEQYQWYLASASVTGAWTRFENDRPGIRPGQNVNISVIDDAVQINHEDLSPNIEAGESINLHVGNNGRSPLTFNPSPNENCDPHGTAVAGIIAAAGDNGIGIKGISYGSRLWGANLLLMGGMGGLDVVRVLRHRLALTAVSSNSWSPTGLGLNDADDRVLQAMNDGITSGWGGLGTNFVFSSGNDRNVSLTATPRTPFSGARSDYDEIRSHRAAIVVCAVGEDDIVSTYSEPGANLWLCGYSNTGSNIDGIGSRDTINAIPAPIRTQTNIDAAAATAVLPNDVGSRWARLNGLPTTDLLGNVGYNQMNNTILRLPSSSTDIADCNFFPGTAPPFNFGSQFLIIESGCVSATPGADAVISEIPWAGPMGGIAGMTPPLPLNNNNASYHRYFTGTSAAAPVVSGVIGLIRSFTPELTWRDVKVILAESATIPPSLTAANSQNNGNRYTNTGQTSQPYFHHDDYGFGIVNASRAVELADSWTRLPQERSWQSLIRNARGLTGDGDVINYPTDEDNTPSNNESISFIEHVEVEIMPRTTNPIELEGLQLTLLSPEGSSITLVERHSCTNTSAQPVVRAACPAIFTTNFNFGVAALLGEDPNTVLPADTNDLVSGRWRLQAIDANDNAISNPPLQYRIRIYGHTRI